MTRVGQAVGREKQAEAAVADFDARIHAATEIGRACSEARDKPLTVAVLEWFEPIFPGGHWTPQLVRMAGAEHPLNPPRYIPLNAKILNGTRLCSECGYCASLRSLNDYYRTMLLLKILNMGL